MNKKAFGSESINGFVLNLIRYLFSKEWRRSKLPDPVGQFPDKNETNNEWILSKSSTVCLYHHTLVKQTVNVLFLRQSFQEVLSIVFSLSFAGHVTFLGERVHLDGIVSHLFCFFKDVIFLFCNQRLFQSQIHNLEYPFFG